MISPIRIDVCALARSAPASGRPHLVTRPTGRAVRKAIEGRLAAPPVEPAAGSPVRSSASAALVSLVDFTRVHVMDFSCADEVVAKLLLRYLGPNRPRNAFFLFRAVAEAHRHALKEVLGRQGLAAVCDVGNGCFRLLGRASPGEREAWGTLERRRRMGPGDAATALGSEGARRMHGLAERRLVYVDAGGAVSALSAFAANGDGRP